MRMIRNSLLWPALAAWAMVAHAQGPAVEAPAKEQVWEGKLALSGGLSLRMVFHVRPDKAGGLSATFDSPDQGAKGLPVNAVTMDKTKITFEMKLLKGRYEGKLNAEGTQAEGEWTQGSVKLPLALTRGERASELHRPQTPRPPFPYKAEDVTYVNKVGGNTLAGTLTTPPGEGPFPAVVLISGSGAQDRDETIFEHKPFGVIADFLTRRGIAVLRVDDRGVGGSSGEILSSTSEDFAGDVLAGIAFLKTQPKIAADKIGLIGHSEGGIIAPMVATRSPDVAFIVLLAGPGVPGDEIIRLQSELILRSLGVDEKTITMRADFQRQILEVAKSESNEQVAAIKMKDVLKTMIEASTPEERKSLSSLDSMIDAQLKSLRSPWFRFFLAHDPRPTLEKVRCPVLALIGGTDLQVPPKENLGEIRKALQKGGNSKAVVKELAELNHLFQTSKSGSPTEYATIEQTIAPEALAAIGSWVDEQVKAPAR